MFTVGNFRLRRAELHDAYRIKQLKEDTWENTHHIAFVTDASQDAWMESVSKDVVNPKNLLMFFENVARAQSFDLDHEAIGIYKIFDIDWVSRTANVGWDVFSYCRGRGLGKLLVSMGSQFCIEVLGLRRLDCEILANNEKSMKCAERVGFLREGTKRSAVFKRGTLLDSHVYGLMAPEFKNYEHS